MNILVAGISGERQYVKSQNSFEEIRTRPGDEKLVFAIGRGDVSRVKACLTLFENPQYDALALFDIDMLFPEDALERLRSHNLDMVCGHYYARNSRNIHSICWEVGDGKWPFPPMIDVPREGLHEIGCTGLGCILIKREVLEAVRDWMGPQDNPLAIGPLPQLTGDWGTMGSDFRFFTAALHLGYKLFLDATIDCKHATIFWMGHEIADRMRTNKDIIDRLDEVSTIIAKEPGVENARKALILRVQSLEARLEDYVNQKAQFEQSADLLERQIAALRNVIADEKHLLETIFTEDKFPVATEEEQKSMAENRLGLEGVSEEEVARARESVAQESARGFVEDLDARSNS